MQRDSKKITGFMKNFLEYLLKLIANIPDELVVEETKLSDTNYLYLIKAAQEDIPRIIGKQGKVIQSVRNIAKIYAIKKGIKIQINIA